MFRTKDSNGNVKYAGSSTAIVLDNRDPLNKGRIIVDHALLGNTVWIDYLRVPGIFSVPSIGDIVYVECDAGVYEFPFAWGNKTKGEDAAPEIPDKFKRTVPTNRGMYTPGGHFIEMDDGEAPVTDAPQDKNYTPKGRGIRVTSSANNMIHIIEDTEAGKQYILIQDKEGSYIKLDYKDKELTIHSVGKTKVETATDKTETVGGNSTETITGNLTVNVTGNATIKATGNVSVESDGNATFKGTGGTTVGDGGSTTQVQGSQVMLAGGGPGVARLGDRAFGIGNLGAPVSSTIIQGSTKVLSG